MIERKARVIAMYLPQYHPIPLNNEWWGPGFTEWTNVASSRPLFRGHNQPRIPADLGFYDLRMPEVREAQAQLAREAGIEGFMYWHYWFGKGKRLLERPFNEVLKLGKPDFPFCLGWANHNWSRKTWTAKNGGNAGSNLVEQTYFEEDYIDHFYDVLAAFKDKRYITVDGKPFFLIYNVMAIPDLKKFINCWTELAIQNGLKGIHFVGNVLGLRATLKIENYLNCGVDAVAIDNATNAEIKANTRFVAYLKKFAVNYLNWGPERYRYKDIIDNIHSELEKRDNIYPVIFPDSDRTPRAGKKAVIFTGSTPELFYKFVTDTIHAIEHKPYEHRIIMVNAWNEWGEGCYLEPDTKYGHKYLDALKKALNNDKF